MDEQRRITPRLTSHARQRCAEMGVSTKRAKQIVMSPTVAYPGPQEHGDNTCVTSSADPELMVSYRIQEDGTPLIITVLWNTHERYERRQSAAVTS